MENIIFALTYEQAKDICHHYGKNVDELEEFEIGELLDKLIDEALFGQVPRKILGKCHGKFSPHQKNC